MACLNLVNNDFFKALKPLRRPKEYMQYKGTSSQVDDSVDRSSFFCVVRFSKKNGQEFAFAVGGDFAV